MDFTDGTKESQPTGALPRVQLPVPELVDSGTGLLRKPVRPESRIHGAFSRGQANDLDHGLCCPGRNRWSVVKGGPENRIRQLGRFDQVPASGWGGRFPSSDRSAPQSISGREASRSKSTIQVPGDSMSSVSPGSGCQPDFREQASDTASAALSRRCPQITHQAAGCSRLGEEFGGTVAAGPGLNSSGWPFAKKRVATAEKPAGSGSKNRGSGSEPGAGRRP